VSRVKKRKKRMGDRNALFGGGCRVKRLGKDCEEGGNRINMDSDQTT